MRKREHQDTLSAHKQLQQIQWTTQKCRLLENNKHKQHTGSSTWAEHVVAYVWFLSFFFFGTRGSVCMCMLYLLLRVHSWTPHHVLRNTAVCFPALCICTSDGRGVGGERFWRWAVGHPFRQQKLFSVLLFPLAEQE